MKDKWFSDWQNAKKEFEELTGKKKPAAKVLIVFRKSSGVESALKKCDDGIKGLQDNWTKGDDKRKQSQTAMRQAIDAYKKTAADYSKMLDQAITKEVTDKDDKTVFYRGLKMLKAKLGQYGDSYEESLAFDTAEQAKGEDYANRHWKIAETKLKAAVSAATAACKTAAAEIAKNNAEAWPEFISQIGQGSRQMQWALGDVQRAIEQGVNLTDPSPYLNSLTGLEKKVPNMPTGVDASFMMGLIKELATIAKDIKAAYKI